MSDLVTRLRKYEGRTDHGVTDEAADRIEELEAKNEQAVSKLSEAYLRNEELEARLESIANYPDPTDEDPDSMYITLCAIRNLAKGE